MQLAQLPITKALLDLQLAQLDTYQLAKDELDKPKKEDAKEKAIAKLAAKKKQIIAESLSFAILPDILKARHIHLHGWPADEDAQRFERYDTLDPMTAAAILELSEQRTTLKTQVFYGQLKQELRKRLLETAKAAEHVTE